MSRARRPIPTHPPWHRPLFRALFASPAPGFRDAALRVFGERREGLHPIAAKMVAADLKLGPLPEEEED